MINPINLIKLDEVRDGEGKTFHIGELPPYDQEDYDLSSPKDINKYITDVKNDVRGSFEYREMIKTLKKDGGMDKSGLNPEISGTDGGVKIEIHHTPLVLEDIVKAVYEKRLANHEDLSVQMVAKEVMECHYKCIVGLYPLSATEHELVHSGYLFIPPENVFGRWQLFNAAYGEYMEEEDRETLDSIEEYGQDFDPAEQSRLMAQSNIYMDPSGAYNVPQLTALKDAMSNRISTIKNNMYLLPTLEPQDTDKSQKLIPAVYFDYEEDELNENPSRKQTEGFNTNA